MAKKVNLALILTLLFHIALFIVFQYLNKGVETWDSAGHISTSMLIANEIKELFSGSGEASLTSILKISNYYPPFVLVLGAISNLVLGYSSEVLLYFGLIFFLLSIVYVYRLVLLTSNDSKLALLTTLIYSIFPQIVDQARVFHLDIPLVTLLVMSFYHLLRSKNFSHPVHSLLFFLLFAFAQLTKWYAWIFLLVPVVSALYQGFIIGDEEGKFTGRRAINVLLGSLTLCVIALPWYAVNLQDLLAQARIFSVGESDDPAKLLSLENFLYYPKNLLTFQLLLLPTIVLLASFVYFYIKKRKESVYYFLLIFIPLLAFIFIGNKNLRYVLPLAPLFAYFIAYFLLEIDKKLKIFTFILAAYLLSGMLFLSFNQLKAQDPLAYTAGIFYTGPAYAAWYYNAPTFYSYDPQYWPIKEMLSYILNDSNKPSNVAVGVSLLIDRERFSAASIEMIRLESHLDNVYFPVPYFQFEPFKSDEEIVAFFNDTGTEYVIAPDDPGPKGLRNFAALKQMVDYLNSPRNAYFEEIKLYTMPDGLNIRIYKRLGVEQKFIASGECIENAGFVDGVESIKLEPNHTYVFYTGHFAIQDKIKRDYTPGILYVVQIENTIHTSILNVHNLPKPGSSLCSRPGLNSDLTGEIMAPLEEPSRCGEGLDCDKVVHVKWKVGDRDVEIEEFSRP